MAEAILVKRLKCVVCHHTLFNPKDLPCMHSVCNDCLDGLVSFQEDGTGTLQCPHGCDGVVKIGVNDSVSSMLSVNYVTQDLLSCVKETKDIDLSLCQDGGLTCDGMARHSCSVCSKKTCTSCWKNHNCENKTSTSVIFDERTETFEALCKQHGAHARIICIDCRNHFICIYCSNRAHQTHMKDTVENHAVNLKNMLSIELENKRVNPILSYKDELNNIAVKRVNLVNELQERIVKKLNHYAKSLNQQKYILLQKFDAKVDEYRTKLGELDSIQKNNVEAFSSYIDKLNTKPFFEILLEKDEIVQKSKTLGSIHCFSASLTDHEVKDNTIGDLYVTTRRKNEMHEDDKVVDVIYEKSYQTDEECVYDFDDFTKNVAELKNFHDSKQIIIRIQMNRIKNNKHSFDDLLENYRIHELKLLLKYRPDVMHLKNSYNETLIYRASELGKHESLRLLLNTNTDSINIGTKYYSPLTAASKNGHTSCVKLLLQHNCDVNGRDNYDRTALMLASEYFKFDCVKLLLANNADINIRDIFGDTAKDYAVTNNIIQIITTHAANNK